jgi:hypothetical protein
MLLHDMESGQFALLYKLTMSKIDNDDEGSLSNTCRTHFCQDTVHFDCWELRMVCTDDCVLNTVAVSVFKELTQVLLQVGTAVYAIVDEAKELNYHFLIRRRMGMEGRIDRALYVGSELLKLHLGRLTIT